MTSCRALPFHARLPRPHARPTLRPIRPRTPSQFRNALPGIVRAGADQHPDPGPDGRTLRVNQAWEDLWEIRAGTPLYAFVLSAEYSLLTDAQLIETGVAGYLQRALAGESVEIPAIYYDVVVLGGSGRARWVTARAHPIKAADGRILEVMLMHEDITERVLAETALREREQRFRSLVMATSQTVWSTTPDGRVLEDSPTWRSLTGQTYEEWKEYGWLDAVHPDDRARAQATWLDATATGSVYETEYRLRHATAATAGRR
jgi:PAS domain-containing protein